MGLQFLTLLTCSRDVIQNKLDNLGQVLVLSNYLLLFSYSLPIALELLFKKLEDNNKSIALENGPFWMPLLS